MAYDLQFAESAIRDYETTLQYLSELSDGPSAATSFADEFKRQYELVVSMPEVYAVSRLEELAIQEIRVAPVNNYVMLYTFAGQTVYILHIYHQRQDYGKLV